MRLQNFRAIRVPILRFPFGSLKIKCHLDIIPMKKHIIYYKEEGDGFFPNLSHLNVMNPK
jgi:hypothetical protein